MAHGLCRKMILVELALSQVMFLNMDRLYNKCDHFQKQSRYKRQLAGNDKQIIDLFELR